jgi:hypothetical protein
MRTAEAVETIARVLAPYLGATMAQASTRAYCEKLGIAASGELASAQAEALVNKLASGLAVFVGREKTATVVAEIRSALELGGAA